MSEPMPSSGAAYMSAPFLPSGSSGVMGCRGPAPSGVVAGSAGVVHAVARPQLRQAAATQAGMRLRALG